MDRADFTAIMDLALTDLKVVEPKTLGIAMIALYRAPDGGLGAQIGSNIGPGMLAALHKLMDDAVPDKRRTRHGQDLPTRSPHRK